MPTRRIFVVDHSPAFLAAATALLDASCWIKVVVRALIRTRESPPMEVEP